MPRKIFKTKKRNPFISDKKNKFFAALTPHAMHFLFKVLSIFAPTLAEKLALRIFMTPPRYATPEWQKPWLASARSFDVDVKGKTIRFYEWGKTGPTILLAHGWGGRGSQMSAFIDPLMAAGYRVLALDAPAHGDSSGKQSDMFELAAAIGAANQVAGGPLDAVIGHSFGAVCSLLAIHENILKTSRLVLIGCPSNAIWITEHFAEKIKISPKIAAGMRRQFERRFDNRWTFEDLSLAGMMKELTIPVLIVHDRHDPDVPWQQAVELHEANSDSQLLTTEGLGHRRVLRAPDVIKDCIDFVK